MEGPKPGAWTLLDGEVQVATLIVDDADFPFLRARVEATTAFSAVRPMFDEELRALETIDEAPDAWDRTYLEIQSRLTLVDPTGRAVPEYVLHIDGDRAWWRWSDEPFEQTTPVKLHDAD